MATQNTDVTDTEHPTNPTASQDYDTTILDHDYNRRLKDALYDTFIQHVTDPCKLMRLLQKYNRNVLTAEDINYIRNFEKHNGSMAANRELLERIPAYKNWFQCLLQAVNSEHIHLGFLQKEFQDIKDDLDNQYLSENDEVMTGTQSFDTGNRTTSLTQRRENIRMKITIERLTKQMRESNDAHRELKQEVTQQKRENERLTKQLKDLNDAHKAKQNDVTTLAQRVSQLENNNALQQEEVKTLRQKMSQLENNNAKEKRVTVMKQNDSQQEIKVKEENIRKQNKARHTENDPRDLLRFFSQRSEPAMDARGHAILGIILGILISLPNLSSLLGDSRRGGKCQHITRYLESPDNTERLRHQSTDPDEASVFQSLQDGEERRRFLNFVKDSPVCTHSHEENDGRRSTTPSGDATARIIIDLSREYCVRLRNSGARNIPVYCTQTNG